MTTITTLIMTISMQMNFDPHLAIAVATTESNLNQSLVGGVGEIGLFQIRPEYSRYSKQQLKQVRINIIEGITKLKEAKARCKHKLNNAWLVCYNAGVTGGSRLKYPKLFPYYKKVMANYNNKNPMFVAKGE